MRVAYRTQWIFDGSLTPNQNDRNLVAKIEEFVIIIIDHNWQPVVSDTGQPCRRYHSSRWQNLQSNNNCKFECISRKRCDFHGEKHIKIFIKICRWVVDSHVKTLIEKKYKISTYFTQRIEHRFTLANKIDLQSTNGWNIYIYCTFIIHGCLVGLYWTIDCKCNLRIVISAIMNHSCRTNRFNKRYK